MEKKNWRWLELFSTKNLTKLTALEFIFDGRVARGALLREQRRRGREGSGTGSLGSGIKAMVSGKGRRERGRVRLQIGQIRQEAGAHYLYELLPEANYCAYYLAWHYHQSSDCV